MERESEANKPRVVLFFLLTGLFWFTHYTYVPTMTPYLKSIEISYTMIGAIGGAYGLAQLILRVPLGFLSDRIGRRRVFVQLGVLCSLLSAVLFLLTENAILIWAFRFLAGVSASSWVLFTVLFSSYFERDKIASRISYLNMANLTGTVLAKMTGSAVVNAWGYRAAFLLSAVVGAAALVMSGFVTERVPQGKSRPTVSGLLLAVRDRNLLIMSLLGVFLQMVVFATTNTFTPEMAVRLGADAVQLGILSTIASLPGIFASMLLGWLFARRANLRVILALSFLLGAVGTAMVAFAVNVAMVYAACFVSGLGLGACMTSLLSHCTLTVPEHSRSLAMGFFQAVYGIGMFLGPIVVGVIVDLAGLQAGILFAAALSATGMLLSVGLLRHVT